MRKCPSSTGFFKVDNLLGEIWIEAQKTIARKNLFPRLNEDIKEGDELKEGMVFLFKDDLYKVLETHILHHYYFPNENTKYLYSKL